MFDGNGNWTSDFSAQADRDNGIKILASRFDNIFIADIKESFENCLTKDGQITPIGNFNMGGQRIVNLDDGVNAKDAVNKSQLDIAIDTTVKLTGNQTISDVKTFTSSPVLPTPTAGDNSTKGATTEWVNNSELPDWTAKVSITPDYTFTEKGFLLAWQYTISGQAAYLNGQVILESEGGHDYLGANYNTIFIPVDVGDKLTGTVTGAIFMPNKGV